jgi:hypothetical protein
VRWCHVAAATVAVMTFSSMTFARTRALDVSSEGCPQLDAAEIERILGIELGSVVDEWAEPEPLGVELSCQGSNVRVLAIDHVTDKRISREVDLRRVRDRDRTVALIASQLFLTSWAERLLVVRPELPPPKPLPPAITRETDTIVTRAIAPSTVRPAIAVTAGPRVRSFDAPLGSLRVSARPTLLLGERTRLFLDLSYERGADSRASGSVTYLIAGGSAGLGRRFWESGSIGLDGRAMAGVFYVDLTGDPTTLGTIGSTAGGAVGEAGLSIGPTFAVGAMRVGLELGLGVTFPRAVARVARDEDLRLSGLWAGGGLVLAFEDKR